MALDQFVFAPCFLATILPMFSLVQGLSFDDSIKRLKHDYPDVIMTNYMLWPAVQTVNFQLVPLNYQVLVVQVFAIIWNTYLSWKAHMDIEIKTKVTEP